MFSLPVPTRFCCRIEGPTIRSIGGVGCGGAAQPNPVLKRDQAYRAVRRAAGLYDGLLTLVRPAITEGRPWQRPVSLVRAAAAGSHTNRNKLVHPRVNLSREVCRVWGVGVY